MGKPSKLTLSLKANKKIFAHSWLKPGHRKNDGDKAYTAFKAEGALDYIKKNMHKCGDEVGQKKLERI